MKYFNEQNFLPVSQLINWIEKTSRNMIDNPDYNEIQTCEITWYKKVVLQWEEGFECGGYALCLSVHEGGNHVWSNGESDIVVFKYDNDDRIVGDEIHFEEGMYTLLSFIIDRL